MYTFGKAILSRAENSNETQLEVRAHETLCSGFAAGKTGWSLCGVPAPLCSLENSFSVHETSCCSSGLFPPAPSDPSAPQSAVWHSEWVAQVSLGSYCRDSVTVCVVVFLLNLTKASLFKTEQLWVQH